MFLLASLASEFQQTELRYWGRVGHRFGGLIDADQSPTNADSVVGTMPTSGFVHRYPKTALHIQAFAAEEITEDEDM
jgi:hypothetical protein